MQGREIKFRIWDKDLKKMRVCGTDIHDSIAFDMDNNAVYYNMQNGCGSLADGTGTYDLMQFTGLRDKNGKEIYEGDVVRFIDVGVIGSQHYKNEGEPKGVVRWSDFGAFYLNDGDEGPFMHSMTEFEVIGNVYENPELLEVGNDASRT